MKNRQKSLKLPVSQMEKMIKSLYICVGFPEQDAEIISKLLTLSEARGIKSHGINMLPGYLNQILKGGINKNPKFKYHNETPNTIVMDGDNGSGHLIAYNAMKIAVDKANQNTIGAVTVKNSNHFGAASSYLDLAADKNMIAIVTTTTTPLMTAPKGTKRMIGNNPLAAVIPRLKRNNIIFDISMSEISASKIKQHKDKALDLPSKMIINKDGEMSSKPSEYFQGGSLKPLGGHKGFVISLLFDVLSGGLSNGGFSKDVKSWRRHPGMHSNISHFVMAIKIESFIQLDSFNSLLNDYTDFLENIEPFSNDVERCIPGKNLYLRYKDSLKNGLMVSKEILSDINDLFEKEGINMKLNGDGDLVNAIYDNNK